MGNRFNVEGTINKIKALPKVKEILKVDNGLDIVIHEFLEDVQDHKGTICDIKDLTRQTIYRVRYIEGVYCITVVINSPISTELSETFATLDDAMRKAIELMNK